MKKKIKIGSKCYWNDSAINDYPIEEQSALLERVFTVVQINGSDFGSVTSSDDIILISDGDTEAEVFVDELILI